MQEILGILFHLSTQIFSQLIFRHKHFEAHQGCIRLQSSQSPCPCPGLSQTLIDQQRQGAVNQRRGFPVLINHRVQTATATQRPGSGGREVLETFKEQNDSRNRGEKRKGSVSLLKQSLIELSYFCCRVLGRSRWFYLQWLKNFSAWKSCFLS